jgi:hypothetical protein
MNRLKLLLPLLLLLLCCASARAQDSKAYVRFVTALPASCQAGVVYNLLNTDGSNSPGLYRGNGSGTCTAVGGGATINATNGTLPKRSSDTAYADSLVSESGTTVRVNGNLTLNGAFRQLDLGQSIILTGTSSKGLTIEESGSSGTRLTINQSGLSANREQSVANADGRLALANTTANAIPVLSSTAGVFSNSLLTQGTNTIEQRNGANAQIFRAYNTYTDASNYERMSIGPVSNVYTITGEAAGTGSVRNISIISGARLLLQSGTQAIRFQVNGSSRWDIDTGGHLVPITAGAVNVGDATHGIKQLFVDATLTAAGTTGAQTINKAAGAVNFAAGESSLTVTNSLVTANSLVLAVVRTNDSTALIKSVVPAAGSFTITLSAAATAETSVGFHVINQ